MFLITDGGTRKGKFREVIAQSHSCGENSYSLRRAVKPLSPPDSFHTDCTNGSPICLLNVSSYVTI